MFKNLSNSLKPTTHSNVIIVQYRHSNIEKSEKKLDTCMGRSSGFLA